jgi:hypothetical protein
VPHATVRHGHGQARAKPQSFQLIAQMCSQECRERVDVFPVAGSFTIGKVNHAGVPPGHRSRYHACYCALEVCLVLRGCARGRGKYAGPSLVAGDLVGDKNPLVKRPCTAVKTGWHCALTLALLVSLYGWLGLGEKRFSSVLDFQKMLNV